MILFNEEEFLPHLDKFKLSTNHENSWDFFVSQYENVLRVLNRTAVAHQYALNIKSYPYLFTLRHYCELKLKSVIKQRGIEIPKSHNFADIIPLLDDLPQHLISAIQKIDLDEDGSCFRYFYDKNGEVGPLYGKKMEFLDFYDDILKIPADGIYGLNLGLSKPFHKRLVWEFTFHFNEVRAPGIFRSSYDDMTSFLLKAVVDNKVGANDVYLPLLYFIRHSIELALKESLMGMLHVQSEESQRKILRMMTHEHKLSRLFTAFINSLQEAHLTQLPIELQEQYANYKLQTDELKESVHLLDANSRYFKYPFEEGREHLNISATTLMEIIPLFLKVDVFLTFTVDIFKEHNLVPYTDREIEQMIGYSPEIS